MKHPFAELIGLVEDKFEEGVSYCRLHVHEELYNPYNVVHGGVLYSLADTGMGFALQPFLEAGETCATIEIKISYFRPVREGVLECRSRLINKGKAVASLESSVFNREILVAKACGSFAIL